MPLQWLLAPNGRVMYSLKTFAIRQASTGLKKTLNLYQKGVRTNNAAMKRQALKNLISYFAIVPTANMAIEEVKDLFKYLGQDVEIEDETLWDKWSTSLLKMYAVSDRDWETNL
jgi:HEPN domain-containing protein